MNYRDRLVELLCNLPEQECITLGGRKIGKVYQTVGTIADHLIENGVAVPVRCRECKEFISKDNLDKEEYPNPLDCDGLCDNTDKYTYADDYCSYGEREENGDE